MNLSPAIARRTPDHNQMIAHMSQGLVDLAVLPHVHTGDENAKEEEAAMVREFLSPRGGSPRDLTHLLKNNKGSGSTGTGTCQSGLGEWVKLEPSNIGQVGRDHLALTEDSSAVNTRSGNSSYSTYSSYNPPSQHHNRMSVAQQADFGVQRNPTDNVSLHNNHAHAQPECGRPTSRGAAASSNSTKKGTSSRPSSAGPLGRRNKASEGHNQGYPGFGAAPPLPVVQPERELGLEIGYALCGNGISVGGIMHQDQILTRFRSILLLQVSDIFEFEEYS